MSEKEMDEMRNVWNFQMKSFKKSLKKSLVMCLKKSRSAKQSGMKCLVKKCVK